MWGISYMDPQGQQVRKMISTYRETAEKVLRKTQTEIDEGRYLDLRKKLAKVLFQDLARDYVESYVRLENRTAHKQANKVANIVRFFGGRYLHQITTLDIRRFMAERANKVKPSSINRDVSMVRCMFNRAREWGMIEHNPTAGIRKLAENNERCRWLTEEEQNRLLSFCHGLTRTIVVVALRTGMRWGEIAHLKWQQAPESNYVDFDRGIIFIHGALSKSKKSRWIPLGQIVKWELLNVPKQKGTDYLFLNPETGKPLGSIKDAFNRAVRKAEIKDFTFHSLRHTFASQLVRNGVDLYVVQKLLGHSCPQMTQRYAHLREDMLIDAIKKIDTQFDPIVYNAVLKNSTFSAHRPFQGSDELNGVFVSGSVAEI
jgi:integrase